ncbi:unnamed protein product [Boreogadus saida]
MTRLTSSRENFACLLEGPRTTNHWFRKFGYLYEPEYSQEELTLIGEEAAAAAAEQALPVAKDEEPERAGSLCSPIDTNTESLCCNEFQR